MKSSDKKTRSQDQQRFINPWRRFIGAFVPNWLMVRTEVSPQGKLLYARLAQYAGQKGVAWPRQDTLARELGCAHPRTIRRWVKELREHGLIYVEPRDNKNFPNKYKFLDHPWQHEEEVIDDVELTPEGQSAAGDTGTQVHRTKMSSGTGQDCPVVPDSSVPSRRESWEETHSKEDHDSLPERSARPAQSKPRRPRKPDKGPPTPKTFEDVKTPVPLGSVRDEASGEIEGEEAPPDSAARPKTRKKRVAARMTDARKRAAEAAEKAKAQVSANAQKRMKAQEAKEQRQKNLKSGGPKGPGVRALEKVWVECMAVLEPELTIAWDAKQRGQAKHLIERYGVQIASDALRYVVENWNKIGPRYFKRPGVPTVGLVLKLHDSLVIEAQKWSQHRETISEWEEWAKENPYSLDPPGDLKARYQKAKNELQALGIGGP